MLSPRPNTSLSERTALITGASGALGADVARALHARGVKVGLLGRNTEALAALEAELGGRGHALAIEANVRSLASLEAAAKTLAEHFSGIDIVIAGAGMATTALVDEYSATGFQDDIDTNLVGVWRTFRATLPYVKRSRGHLCAISSLAAFVHLPGMSAYAASKVGVLALCNSLRQELEGTGVSVGTVHPTFFASALGESLEAAPVLRRASANFTGPFRLIERKTVVEAVVRSIEKRSRTVVLPRLYQVANLVPGIVQRGLEPVVRLNSRRTR